MDGMVRAHYSKASRPNAPDAANILMNKETKNLFKMSSMNM